MCDWFGCEVRCQIQTSWESNDLVVIWSEIQTILVVIWFEIQMILVVNWFEIQLIWLLIDLRLKWFGCQSMCASNDFGCLLIWTSSDVVVNKWFGCQLIRDSSDLVNRFEIQMTWLSIDLRFKWSGCQMIWGSSDLVVNWCVIQMVLVVSWPPSKLKLWSSKTKLFCETSFKNEALKIKNQAFLRDFLKKPSFEAQKRSFSARLPSKM